MKDVNEAENLWDKNLLRKFRFRSCPHQMKDLEKENDFLVRDSKVMFNHHHHSAQLTRTNSQIHSACVVQSSLKILTECIRIVGTFWDWGWVIGGLFCLLKCCLLLSAIHHWLASIQSNMIVILNSKTPKLLKFDYIDGSPDYIYRGWGRIGDDWRVNWSRGKLFWYI